MIFETLYSTRSDGKIQSWTIEVKNNKYRTISGILGGKIVTSEWTIAEGKNKGKKNETTGAEQALLEAQSKFKKKLDLKYCQNINHLQNKFKELMLAKDFKKYVSEIDYPVYAQPKLDGIRCKAGKEGLFSRLNKAFVSIPHIYEDLKSLLSDYTFDGEIYADKYNNDFNKICSIAKKSKPTQEDLDFSKENIEYHIYDIIDTTKIFSERWAILESLKPYFEGTCIRLVETKKAESLDDLDKYYIDWLDRGYEGEMIRIDSKYHHGRTKNLMKRKEWQDAEFEILDILEGKGNRSGMAGKLLIQIKKGVTSEANIKGGYEFYKSLLINKKNIIGKQVTVKFFGYTPEGRLRFPTALAIRDYE